MTNKLDPKLHSETQQILNSLLCSESNWINPVLFYSHPEKIQHDGEYCYFAANPSHTIKGSNLALLEKRINAHKAAHQTAYKAAQKTSHSTGFTSGWAGMLQYPDSGVTEYEFHYYPWVLKIDNHSGEITLTGEPSGQALSLKDQLIQSQLTTNANLKKQDSKKENPTATLATLSCSAFRHLWNKQQYQIAFNKVQEYLVAGDCYQINLTHPAVATYSGEPSQAASALFSETSPSFACYFEAFDRTLLSLSPERLIKIDSNGQMQAKPIKGTIKRSSNHDQDAIQQHALINSTKDQAENLMIVDLLRNDLSHSAQPGSVKVDKLFELETHPYVHHLVSTISAQLEADTSPVTALCHAFPGGSITGAPKKRAMEIITELEAMPRSLYCGSFGYISDNGELDFNILIRSLEFKDGKVWCWGGGGITVDSNMEDEYQESLTKTQKIREILESFK
jgi:para-aminobenzoate synthetase component 1